MRLRLSSWRWLLWAFFLAGGIAFASLSPEASGSRDDVPYTGVPVQVSAAAVVDMRALARAPTRPEPASPPEPRERPERTAKAKAPPELPLSTQIQTPTIPSPYVSGSFLAQTDTPVAGKKTESPPDTNGAVGREKLMSTLNSNYVIQRKSDGKVLSRVSMTSFWSRLGMRHPFDPRVLYDPYSDRWLVSAANDPLLASSAILYGISDTSDPQGTWHLYAIDSDPTNATWADFPTLGFDHSTVAIGVNMFAAGTGTYVSGRLITLDYAALRAGGSGQPADITIPGGFALQPAVTYSPTEATLYLVEHVDSISATYRFWSLRGSTLTVVGGAPKTNPLGPWGTPGPGNFLPQADGRGVDADDSRVGNAVFRNGHVWYAQTINLPPSGGVGFGLHTAVQWVELDTNGAFVQGGRIEDARAMPWNGGHSYAYAAIAVNARDDVLVGFSDFQSERLRGRGLRLPIGRGRAGHDARAGNAEGRRGAVHEDARRPQSLGRLQRRAGRPVRRSRLVDGAGVRAHPDGPGRRVGPLGSVVGPGRRRAAVAGSAMQGAESGRRRPRESVAASRSRALPPVEGAAREGAEEAGPGRPAEPGGRPNPPQRRENQPHGRSLSERLYTRRATRM